VHDTGGEQFLARMGRRRRPEATPGALPHLNPHTPSVRFIRTFRRTRPIPETFAWRANA